MKPTGGPAARLLGAVLAGGASTRFGTAKWRFPVMGEPMGARAVAALRPHAAKVVAIAGDPEVAALGVEVRPDLVPGQGPLGGVRTALAWAQELSLEGVIVLACDLPLVSAALLDALVSGWVGDDAVAPAGPAGVEPLCALYATALLPEVEAALARGTQCRVPAGGRSSSRGRASNTSCCPTRSATERRASAMFAP